LKTLSHNFRNGMVPISGILIICFLGICSIQAIARQPLSNTDKRIVVLDPGHGGRLIGARGAEGTVEKALSLEMAQLVAAELGQDYKVHLTRTDDYHVDLVNRTAQANHFNANVFVSLHTGGSFVYSNVGPIIYYYQSASKPFPNRKQNQILQSKSANFAIPWQRIQNNYNERSRILARMINSRLNTIYSSINVRVQGAPLVVLQGAHMPAILIEFGYLTNPAEEKNLRDSAFLADFAAEISMGIKDFLSRPAEMNNQ
jgi:N-acetylmuramoyl-L-alanine amidase